MFNFDPSKSMIEILDGLIELQSSRDGTSTPAKAGHGSLVTRTRAAGIEEVQSDHRVCLRPWKNVEQIQSNKHILGEALVM